LRRFKRDVFTSFPKKKEIILRVEMSKKQKVLSKCLIEKNFEELVELEKKKSNSKLSIKGANNILMALRLVANHPLLLSHLYSSDNFKALNFGK
jgi:SNF2 family DNA or RNA helicase